MSSLLTELTTRRTAAQTELEALTADGSQASRRGHFTPTEEARFTELAAACEALDERIAMLRASEARKQAAAEARNASGRGEVTPISVLSEPMTYDRHSGNSYFRDLCLNALPHMFPEASAAAERLARHAREVEYQARNDPGSPVGRAYAELQGRTQLSGTESRTGLTTAVGAGGTFLPPAYLLDEYIALPRPERVLADLVRREPLPKGPMTINIPKIASGTAVGSQNGQNTAATETDLTDEYVSAPVNTIAGQQTVSLQAIEQSSIPFDAIIFQDLLRALDAQVEAQVVNGSGSSGQFAGTIGAAGNTVTYTDSTPTAVKAWPFIGQAKSAVFKSIFRAADAILMTPDRWAWFEIATDANGRPLVLPNQNGPWNAMGVAAAGGMQNGPRPAGQLAGLPVYVDAQLPTNLGAGTNQDDILVVSASDLILWESTPVARALPQTLGNQLSVLLQVYEYGAYMPNRLAGAISVISGTGLVTPAY